MWDKKRKLDEGLPVIDFEQIHHSAGDDGKNHWDSAIRDALNRTGFSRGYAPYGYDFATGYSSMINQKTGQPYGQNFRKLVSGEIGYCEYHYAVHAYDLDKASPYYGGGFRIVPLLDDPFMVDAGASWNQDINSRSIIIVFLGNYENNDLPKGMIDWFIEQHKPGHEFYKILQHNAHIKVLGHKDIGDATACPGKYLYTFLPRIQREIISGVPEA